MLPVRRVRDEDAGRLQDARERSEHPANRVVVDVLEKIEGARDVDRRGRERRQLRDVAGDETHVGEAALSPPLFGELDRAGRSVDSDCLLHARREKEADVAQSAPEVEHRHLGRGHRQREDVAVPLAPLALRRREERDPMEPVEVLVGIEIFAKHWGSGLHLPHWGSGCHSMICVRFSFS